jgi:hypothetical protein
MLKHTPAKESTTPGRKRPSMFGDGPVRMAMSVALVLDPERNLRLHPSLVADASSVRI